MLGQGERNALRAVAAKDTIARSPLTTRSFALLLNARASWNAVRGRRSAALDDLLRALRVLGSDQAPSAWHRQLGELLASFCTTTDGRPGSIRENRLLSEFQQSDRARELRAQFAGLPLEHRLRLRFPRPPENPERQGDLMVLKEEDAATGERGVLLLAYTEAIERFAAIFDVAALAAHYQLVLEPSWWGYEDAIFLRLLGHDADVVVQAPWRRDFDFISSLRSNLQALRVGAGDWTDPDVFRPKEGPGRSFDLVMVSNWNPLKRHAELFATLAEIRRDHGRTLRVALVGYPAGWTRADIERLARKQGVAECCSIFENIPQAQVAEIVADSRVHALLSRREGANRAIYEALFCDTPVIVPRGHRGVNADHVVPETGILFDDGDLARAIVTAIDDPARFAPRAWALRHTGYHNATRLLEQALRDGAARHGRPWTRGIAPKKNLPNVSYARPGLYRDFAAEYERLGRFLLPPD